ncbi:hypothetical protein [Acanthopleuribacter pedis]|uniref:Uncharacterized protein n=1 Tax=Acanthopleuribacter pedis TaxID=442870 RepID=A0A8J7Q4Z1_9BACT|nr:hypothetical protein [Acanthopleuribacter pedis]MBO1320527.1 hypothetical protein [Acanthopleuribacter pedis]
MGKLRLEPKVKPLVTGEEYENLLSTLRDAQADAGDNYIYFDLEENEKAKDVKKAFLFVAEKEGISVVIRQQRGVNSLVFSFKDDQGAGGTSGGSGRMSAEEARDRILSALKNAKGSLQKSEILKDTGVSSSTWNIRIKELIDSGEVKRDGERRDTRYTYAG